ncbi:MAG TPA: phosphoribosylformylglycinamidine cyclo-ligase, partial [Streptosporangiaceae bacterium]|nr:phosphoribosylformylglycinamidine cyclo-ligase [Streptosporangiaceae bacterium]
MDADVPEGGLSYTRAGVDIGAGERAVDLIRAMVARTAGPEVVGGIGGFAGLFDASKLTSYRRPLLATATDGVGTKVVIARQLGVYDTVGIDLVGMVVDDLVVCGAEPLFLTDYVVCGQVRPERVAAIVAGVAQGCVLAGCALIGGETAEHPGHLGPDDFDLAGAATGVVEADRLLGPDRVRRGDVVIAMASSGLHSNGFSLVRRVISQAGAALDLDAAPPELGRPLGEELLTPTRVYARDCLALAGGCDVHAFAHVTGGGLASNLARVLPAHADAVLNRATWSPQPVF